MSNYDSLYEEISELINSKVFKIPNEQQENSYFPDFLKSKLDDYTRNISDKIKDNNISSKIKNLSTIISETIELYYKGQIYKASKHFSEYLKLNLEKNKIFKSEVNEGDIFYRARLSGKKQFNVSDLFHIKFEERHKIKTQRYSIPGFPALYLGNSTYTCWEEFERTNLRDLWFSKFETQKKMYVILIERIEGLLEILNEDSDKDRNYKFLTDYLAFFPLILSSTIKVKNPSGNFKPEYIIPQMLLEYISNDETISGIQFPSTKIDYNSLVNIEANNFVFPVKKIAKEGHCSILSELFYLTAPTSLEIEETIDNSPNEPPEYDPKTNDISIEFIKDIKTPYHKTSFAKIESRLKNRELYKIN